VDILTAYVGQGALAGLRIGNEGIVVDAHMPDAEDVTPDEIKQTVSTYFQGVTVRGLLLTGLDKDHAHPDGVEWVLSELVPDWVMYPKYYKDTDCATQVFASIEKHEKKRRSSVRPLARHSVRLDRLDSREISGLGRNFTFELFSPHIEDMDSSNNCSIVAKISGHDATGFHYLVTGDTEIDRWETISRLFGTSIASDVMAAPHHGSISGTYPKTILEVNPNTVLVSAGVDNQFDHPTGAAILAYQKVAKHIFATNAGGQGQNLLTRRDGNDFQTKTFSHAEASTA
jgi:beta-lactamase superfamily II metal-dependent hydrolase